MSATFETAAPRLFAELDYREGDGIEVSLLWNRRDNSLSVYVFDGREDMSFELAVTPIEARDAFLHPFAFLSA
jgi:hypothetical protein